MAPERVQQEAVPGVPHADGGVVRADQQHPARPLLRRGQAAHRSRTVALEHVQLPRSLTGGVATRSVAFESRAELQGL